MAVLAIENAQFAAGSESQGLILNDVNEEIDGLQPNGTHGNQITSSRKLINPSDHGLILLEFLFVTALIHELAIVRRGRPTSR